MKRRLLDEKNFQGARHELWTAALFVAANFKIEFEDESDASSKHPEFVATDRETGARIAVEAKSRHRKGVKGFASGLDRAPGAAVDARGLVLDAYGKETTLPLYVVIDANLPPESHEGELQRWLDEIETLMDDLAAEGYADPCPANAIFFHNDPSHYIPSERIGGKLDNLWITHIIPLTPRVSDEHTSMFLDRVLQAHTQRLHPPLNIPEDLTQG